MTSLSCTQEISKQPAFKHCKKWQFSTVGPGGGVCSEFFCCNNAYLLIMLVLLTVRCTVVHFHWSVFSLKFVFLTFKQQSCTACFCVVFRHYIAISGCFDLITTALLMSLLFFGSRSYCWYQSCLALAGGQFSANLPNRYSVLCWRPVTRAQTWASYSALYGFGRLSKFSPNPWL